LRKEEMLQFMIGLVLVVLVLAYGLRWTWRRPVRRVSPKDKTFVVTGAASGFGKEGSNPLPSPPPPSTPHHLLHLSSPGGACRSLLSSLWCAPPAVTKMLAEQGGYVFAVDLNEELLTSEWRDNPNVHTLRCAPLPPSGAALSTLLLT
jgi:hypothetical protein